METKTRINTCPDCGGHADYYKIESGYFEASCPDCGYYETGFDMGEDVKFGDVFEQLVAAETKAKKG